MSLARLGKGCENLGTFPGYGKSLVFSEIFVHRITDYLDCLGDVLNF